MRSAMLSTLWDSTHKRMGREHLKYLIYRLAKEHQVSLGMISPAQIEACINQIRPTPVKGPLAALHTLVLPV